MLDIEPMGLFGGVGDRRLRPHSHQALKCPRCDSLNTKFCYYNNYNLSQPRHFCKSCRRYWTRGGVLRNVPVGGGCRKTKRSSKPIPLSSSTTTAPEQNKSSSNSSSSSSSLTASATAETVSAPSSCVKASNVLEVTESKVSTVQGTTSPSLEQQATAPVERGAIFSEMGSFTSLIASSNDPLLYGQNNVADISQFRMNQEQQKMMAVDCDGDGKIQEMTSGLLDEAEFTGLGSLDWASGGGEADEGLFVLLNTVDQTYWSHTQWNDQDHPNFFLP